MKEQIDEGAYPNAKVYASSAASAGKARKSKTSAVHVATAAGVEVSMTTEPRIDEGAYPNNNCKNGTPGERTRNPDTAATASRKARNPDAAATTTPTSSEGLNAAAAPATAKDTTGKYPRDRLDVHVEKEIAAFEASTSWANFVTSVRGRGDLDPGVKKLPHPAAHLLSRFQKSGTPAMIKTAPWSVERIDDALKRGPHQFSHRCIEFL